jgi:hypothetical protein
LIFVEPDSAVYQFAEDFHHAPPRDRK